MLTASPEDFLAAITPLTPPQPRRTASRGRSPGTRLSSLLLLALLFGGGACVPAPHDTELTPDDETNSSVSPSTRTRRPDSPRCHLRHTLQGHTDRIDRLAFSPDGTVLASASSDQSIRLWQVRTGAPLSTLLERTRHDLNAPSPPMAFSPHGDLLAVARGDFTLWDLAPLRKHCSFDNLDEDIVDLTFCPDGKTLAILSIDPHYPADQTDFYRLTLREATTWQEQCRVDHLDVSHNSLLLSPAGQYLLLIHLDTEHGGEVLSLRDPMTLRELRHISLADFPVPGWNNPQTKAQAYAFSPDDRFLAVSCPPLANIRLFDPLSGLPIRDFQEFGWGGQSCTGINSLAFSADGRRLLVGSWSCEAQGFGDDRNIHWLDVESGKVLCHAGSGHGYVTAVACSPDGVTFAAAHEDHTITLWEGDPKLLRPTRHP